MREREERALVMNEEKSERRERERKGEDAACSMQKREWERRERRWMLLLLFNWIPFHWEIEDYWKTRGASSLHLLLPLGPRGMDTYNRSEWQDWLFNFQHSGLGTYQHFQEDWFKSAHLFKSFPSLGMPFDNVHEHLIYWRSWCEITIITNVN